MTATLEEIGEALLMLSQATTENTKKPALQKFEAWIQDCPEAVNTAILHYLQDSNEKIRIEAVKLLDKLQGLRQEDFFSKLLNLYMVETKQGIAFDMASYYVAKYIAQMNAASFKAAMQQLLESIMNGDVSKRAKYLNLLEHFILEDEYQITGTLHSTISMVIDNALLSGNANYQYAAIHCLIHALCKDKPNESFKKLVLPMLQAIVHVCNELEQSVARQTLDSLIEFVAAKPGMVKKFTDQYINAMLLIVQQHNISKVSEIRDLALEALCTFAEKNPNGISKYPNFLDLVFTGLSTSLANIAELKDTDINVAEEMVEDAPFHIAMSLIDRFAIALDPTLVFSVFSPKIATMMNSSDWRTRCVGIMLMNQIAEPCRELFIEAIPKLTLLLTSMTKDSNPRVRWSALNCIGQFCTDLQQEFQVSQATKIFPVILTCLGDVCPAVQAHACAASINLIEDNTIEAVGPFLTPLMAKFLPFLQNESTSIPILESALPAVAATAEITGTMFDPHYDNVIAAVKKLLQKHSESTGNVSVYDKCLECISFIVHVCNPKKSKKDALYFMDHLSAKKLEANAFVVEAVTRVGAVLKDEISPYLSKLLPVFIAKMNEILPQADGDAEENEVVEKLLKATEVLVETKSSILKLLARWLEQIPDKLMPHIASIGEIVGKEMKSSFSTQLDAISCLPPLYKIAQKTGRVATMGAEIMKLLVEGMQHSDLDTVSTSFDCLDDILKFVPQNAFQSNLVGFASCIDSANKRVFNKKQKAETDDDDDEQDADEQDAIYDCRESIMLIIESLMKTHTMFPSIFANKYYNYYLNVLKNTKNADEFRAAACIFISYVEFSPVTAVNRNTYNDVLPHFIKHAHASDHSVRQCIFYAFGTFCQTIPELFAPFATQALKMMQPCYKPKSKDDDERAASCNAISALYKIAMYQKLPNSDDLLRLWLQQLPVGGGDDGEARIIHANLMQLVEANNSIVFGATNANIPNIIGTFVAIYKTNSLSEDVQTRFAAWLGKTMASASFAEYTKWFNILPKPLQVRLQDVAKECNISLPQPRQ